MELSQAINTIEYKIATETDSFSKGFPIKMDISNTWPPEADLGEALSRKYPFISIRYDRQANNCLQLILQNNKPAR